MGNLFPEVIKSNNAILARSIICVIISFYHSAKTNSGEIDSRVFDANEVGWVLRHINFCRLFNAKSIFMQIVLFQIIQFSMSIQFNYQKHFYFKLFSLVKQF